MTLITNIINATTTTKETIMNTLKNIIANVLASSMTVFPVIVALALVTFAVFASVGGSATETFVPSAHVSSDYGMHLTVHTADVYNNSEYSTSAKYFTGTIDQYNVGQTDAPDSVSHFTCVVKVVSGIYKVSVGGHSYHGTCTQISSSDGWMLIQDMTQDK